MHYDFTAAPPPMCPRPSNPVFQHVVTTYAGEAMREG
jgi:hypothetical protein